VVSERFGVRRERGGTYYDQPPPVATRSACDSGPARKRAKRRSSLNDARGIVYALPRQFLNVARWIFFESGFGSISRLGLYQW